MFSDNAEPINMARVSRVAPFKLPSVLGLMGPVQIEFFLGRLAGYQYILTPSGLAGQWGHALSDQPFIHGEKLSFKPTPNFEIGFFRDTIFAGTGFGFTTHTFLVSLFSTGNKVAGQPGKQGDRDTGLDFSYRLPFLRNWVTFYADGYSDDEFSPIAYWDRSYWQAGLYFPRLPHLEKLDLRVEGGFTDLPIGGQFDHGYAYSNGTWRSGHTNEGNLMGSWIGRQGQGAQAWSTYHFTPRNTLQFAFRHQKISDHFIPGGGTLTNASVGAEFLFRSGLGLSTSVRYEKWSFPVLSNGPQVPAVVTVQVTYWPRLGLR